MDFKLSDGFFDLCVNVLSNNQKCLEVMLTRLYEMGYKTVALNQTVSENVFDTEKKKRRKGEDGGIVVSAIPEPVDTVELSKTFCGKLRILNRITFICSDSAKTHSLAHCPTLKKYDLYAIVPKNQSTLQFICSQLNTDLISIDMTTVGLKMTRKLYMQAVDRGLHFEIQYTNFLNTDTRKNAIYQSHLFYVYGKSKNVIISSGASGVNEIRNPYDVINLGLIAGLNEARAKASVLWQCKNLLLRAGRRRYGKAVFAIERINPESENDTERKNGNAHSQ